MTKSSAPATGAGPMPAGQRGSLALPDRPLISTPRPRQQREFPESEARRLARQPALGLVGLTLVVPVALFLGAGGPERSLLVLDSFGNLFASYTDGPPTIELWDVPTTCVMTEQAKEELPDTPLGLSILQGENYDAVASELRLESYSYVELNWKYTFRNLAQGNLDAALKEIQGDLDRFAKAFEGLPRMIKLSREAATLIPTPFFESVLRFACANEMALIVANSKRLRVPAIPKHRHPSGYPWLRCCNG
jgi:hypothetical protein